MPGIEPQLTGAEAASRLADDLDAVGCFPEFAAALREVNAALARIDGFPVGDPRSDYDAALAPLSALPVPVDPSKSLQVDLFKRSDSLALSEALVDTLADGAALLFTISPKLDALSAFLKKFDARYEGREVPLLEALDDEVGIGFPSLESDDAIMRRYAETMRSRDRALADLRLRAGDAQTVELTANDLRRLRSSGADVPDSFAAFATLVAPSAEAADGGDYRWLLHGASGPSGARMLGRFAHLDPALENFVREHVRREAALHPDVLFAEIVHLPQGRIGNIAARPLLRDHEIVYLGKSGIPRQNQIDVRDLAVSIRGGRLLLRSVSRDREVRPRLSSAHGYGSARELPVYRFLTAMQDHAVHGNGSWSWGNHSTAAFLPRVTYRNFVLSRAKWSIGGDELREMIAAGQRSANEAVAVVRERRGLPRFIVLSDGDNRLPFDLGNAASIRALVRLLSQRKSVVFEEMYPQPDQLCMRGSGGMYTNEVVVPIVRAAPASANSEDADAPDRAASDRKVRRLAAASTRAYGPGSEWVYAKLYCGTGSGDLVLREQVAPLVDRVRAKGLADDWFFIRYSDDGFHLRLRFHVKGGKAGALIQAVGEDFQPMLANGRLSRLVFDTYRPEIERYGGSHALPAIHSIFTADSEAALVLVGASAAEKRLPSDLVALAGIHRLFSDAGVSLERRITLLDRYTRNLSPAVRRERSSSFRTRRPAIVRALATVDGPATSVPADTLQRRSETIAPLFAQLLKLEEQGQLIGATDGILFSLTHMWVNRVVPNGVAVEPALYDYLQRHYRSEAARNKGPSSAAAVAVGA